MKLEHRHRIAAALAAAIATFTAAAFLSALSGMHWKTIATSGHPGAAYLRLFALVFGWPACILVSAILAKKSEIPYSIRATWRRRRAP